MSVSEKLKAAVDRLSIADMVVKSISAQLADDFVPGVNNPDDLSQFQTAGPSCLTFSEYPGPEESRLIVYDVKCGMRLFSGNSDLAFSNLNEADVEARLVAKFEANFLASYREAPNDGEFLDEECLIEFAKKNVPFNVWPYWRELLQSACGRMGLPKIVLPAHRITRLKMEPKEKH